MRCARRMVDLRPPEPLVSFTFDDFPRSALHRAGAILKSCGGVGTYYVSLGLMDSNIPAGRAFSREDLFQAVEGGHELGCHTFDHCDSWLTRPEMFERSIVENQRALSALAPGVTFKSLSFPISWPRPLTKRLTQNHFACCRGGGPGYNLGWSDAGLLAATFIEKHRDDPEYLFRLIQQNARACGWLILATHDVDDRPSPFGCKPGLFEELVQAVSKSGSRIMPLASAWEAAKLGGMKGNSRVTAAQIRQS